MFTNTEQNRDDKNKALMAYSLICDVLNPLGLLCFALSFFRYMNVRSVDYTGRWWYTPLIPVLERQRQADL